MYTYTYNIHVHLFIYICIQVYTSIHIYIYISKIRKNEKHKSENEKSKIEVRKSKFENMFSKNHGAKQNELFVPKRFFLTDSGETDGTIVFVASRRFGLSIFQLKWKVYRSVGDKNVIIIIIIIIIIIAVTILTIVDTIAIQSNSRCNSNAN